MQGKHFFRMLIFTVLGVAASIGLRAQSAQILNAKALFEERSFSKAKNILDKITESNPDYPDAQYYLGRIAVEEKQYDLSVEKFETAIEANPRDPEFHNWLGVMYGVQAMSANPIKQAYLAPKIKNEFEKAQALDPNNLPTQWGLITYYTKAPGFLGGSWEKAMVCAATIARLNKAQGYRAMGLVHAAQKKTGLAEKEYQLAILEEPNNCEHVFALAQFYNEQHQYDKAFKLYEGVIKKSPDNMVASFHLGQVSAQSGLQADKGITCLNQYLAYKPKPNEPAHSDAQLGLAMIYEKKGDKEMAKKCYQNSLQLQPGMKEAQAGLARVN